MIDRRKFLSIGLIGLSSVALSSCKLNPLKPSIDKENLWKDLPDSTKYRYGFIDMQGNWIIKPQFDRDSNFSLEGVAPVFINRDIDTQSSSLVYSGIIDTSGAWVKEPELGLELGYEFSEGLIGAIQIKDKGSSYRTDNDMGGYLDVQGNWAIEPKIPVGSEGRVNYFSQANSFIQEPYALVPKFINEKNKIYLHGIINKKGDYLIEPRFRVINSYFATDFSNIGLAAAKEGIEDDALYGFIDGSGKWVIKPTFNNASSFRGNYAWAEDVTTELSGTIDQNGEWVIPPQYSYLILTDDTYAVAKDPKTELVGVLDLATGEWVKEPQWYSAWVEHFGAYITAKETEDGLVGMYSMQTGETIIEPKYKYISYDEPLIIAQDPETELYGYIDISGEWVIQPAYRQVSDFYEGLASVSSNT